MSFWDCLFLGIGLLLTMTYFLFEIVRSMIHCYFQYRLNKLYTKLGLSSCSRYFTSVHSPHVVGTYSVSIFPALSLLGNHVITIRCSIPIIISSRGVQCGESAK